MAIKFIYNLFPFLNNCFKEESSALHNLHIIFLNKEINAHLSGNSRPLQNSALVWKLSTITKFSKSLKNRSMTLHQIPP